MANGQRGTIVQMVSYVEPWSRRFPNVEPSSSTVALCRTVVLDGFLLPEGHAQHSLG
ncbi:hypothetical protein VN12_07125 [Pirellula sp. SH-Sr6A]|nr:hypothetical protein VN12_07125 [Pirellula sp. SH-Sr6A]